MIFTERFPILDQGILDDINSWLKGHSLSRLTHASLRVIIVAHDMELVCTRSHDIVALKLRPSFHIFLVGVKGESVLKRMPKVVCHAFASTLRIQTWIMSASCWLYAR